VMLHIAQGAAELGLRPQTVLALFPPVSALLGASHGALKASRTKLHTRIANYSVVLFQEHYFANLSPIAKKSIEKKLSAVIFDSQSLIRSIRAITTK
jgi:hypothetical protein